ncbi:hypothetical protein ABFA07_011256 [Porites harrisoni]
MQKGQKKIIQKNFEALLEDLDPNPLMNFLYQEDIITRDDIDEMDSIKPRKEKSKALLFTLQRRGPNAFLALVEGLIIKKKQWLATLLLKEERQRLSGEGVEETMTSEGEEAESEKEDESGKTTMELKNQLEDVNNRLQLAERERNQYANKCHDLEKQIESSEEMRKDLLKKCNDLEQQLILKESEWSWKWEKDFEKMNEQKNLNSPNPSHGKRTSPSGSGEGCFEETKQLLNEMPDINFNGPSTSHERSSSASDFGESDFQGKNKSRNDISMGGKHQDILRRTWPTLRKDLEPIKLLPDLVDVLDPTDEEEIKASSRKTREDAADKLLEILPRKGERAFDVFERALKKVLPHLAYHLEREDMKTQLNQERAQNAEVRKENQRLKMELEKERQRHKNTKEESYC